MGIIVCLSAWFPRPQPKGKTYYVYCTHKGTVRIRRPRGKNGYNAVAAEDLTTPFVELRGRSGVNGGVFEVYNSDATKAD